jgi:hypothetical protein
MNATDDLDRVFHELANRLPVPPAPAEQLLNRGKRRKRQVGMSAAALGVVAVVTVGLAGAGLVGGGSGQSTQAAAPLLIAAAQATEQTSFKLVVTTQYEGHVWRQEGAYDPIGRQGYLRYTAKEGYTIEQRLIGDDYYHLDSAKPEETPGGQERGRGFALGMAGSNVDPALTVDPAELLRTLQELGTVNDLGGGRYSFSQQGEKPVSGTVEVSSGKVAKVTYDLSKEHTLTLEFSDYGTPVKVERP